MKSKTTQIFAVLIVLGLLAWQCGDDKAGEGDFCEKDSDCESGLICNEANICVKPDAGECIPPCDPTETCVDGQCVPIDPGKDKDGDGFPDEEDCNDLDATIYPGAYEYCDGTDNDCDGVTDEDCVPCIDDAVQDCGTDIGECTVGTQICTNGKWQACSGVTPQPESCDGKDNDCDGLVDEICSCSPGDQLTCSVNQGICTEGVQNCDAGVWTTCSGQLPRPEVCDGQDNDCDGQTDEGLETDLAPDTCAGATDLGDLPDDGSQQTVTGRVWPEGDEDWFMITATDDPVEDQEDGCDSFHFKVVFAHNPGDRLLIDVYAKGCEGDLDCEGDTVYEHSYNLSEVDPQGNVLGQCPCGGEGENDCTAEDKEFHIRVYGPAGTATCEDYELTISNGTTP